MKNNWLKHYKYWPHIKLISSTVAITLFLVVIYANLRGPQALLNHSIVSKVAVSDPRFVKGVGDLLDPAFVDGNSIKTLLNGEQIFPSMLQAIRLAKETITFESYIYWSGETGKEFAEALAERSKAGVKVYLLMDWSGSSKMSKELTDIMKNAGVKVTRYHAPRWYNITRMNNRTHRKILVIDGKIGFTGGVGISDDWEGNGLDAKHWRDTHFRVQGPVVNQMQSAFMDNWLKTSTEVHTEEAFFPIIEEVGSAKAQMFISSASEGGSSVRIMYLMAIAAASKSIHLESAYFVPDEYVISELIKAKKRGVDIQIIVPGPHTDSKIVDLTSQELWGDLLKNGIKIYEYQPALFHCKVLIVDQLFVSVGSTNFDERSFRLNDEANLNVHDKQFASEQETYFKQDLLHSTELTYAQWKDRPLFEKVFGTIFTVLSSQL